MHGNNKINKQQFKYYVRYRIETKYESDIYSWHRVEVNTICPILYMFSTDYCMKQFNQVYTSEQYVQTPRSSPILNIIKKRNVIPKYQLIKPRW